MSFLKTHVNPKTAAYLSALLLWASIGSSSVSAADLRQKSYASPEQASMALLDAAQSGDGQRIRAVFGRHWKSLGSGDPVLAKREREAFAAAYNEKHEVRLLDETKATLVLGKEEWPFPIPLVKANNAWRFDTATGMIEILNRRIGRNETNTIQVLLAIADAQQEYASRDHDGDGLLEFAQKFSSGDGKFDGLYWPVQGGQSESPMGLLVAKATGEGYTFRSDRPTPYWGYYYRILRGQGGAARGGSYSYLAGDSMIGGFAVIASPAEYGASGVKTFMINHDGVVFEKDLGPKTSRLAADIQRFDPGEGWVLTGKSEIAVK